MRRLRTIVSLAAFAVAGCATVMAVSEIGVTGCDHRGVYVWTHSGWVLDSIDAHPAAAAAVAR